MDGLDAEGFEKEQVTMEEAIARYLQADEGELDARWARLQDWWESRFQRPASIEAMLFLLGLQARGQGYSPALEKEEKQGLIMEGTYHAFEAIGLYQRVGMEADGAWIWERTLPQMPALRVDEQEKLLRTALLAYFEALLKEDVVD